MMMKIATKFLHVDAWTNIALRRAIRVLECIDTDPDGALYLRTAKLESLPPVESVRGELRDLLARRRAEGVGKAPFGVWKEAADKTARAERRKANAKLARHRA